MFRSATLMFGAGLLAVGVSMPLGAHAHAEDNALAFVIGAAVGHALDDDRKHRHPHRPHVVRVDRGKHHGWYKQRHWDKRRHWDRHPHRYQHPHWKAKHWKHQRFDARHERRWDRHDRRWDRHDRRWDRRRDRVRRCGH